MSDHDFIFMMSCHDNGHDQVMTTSSRMVTQNCNDGVALPRVVMSCCEVVIRGLAFVACTTQIREPCHRQEPRVTGRSYNYCVLRWGAGGNVAVAPTALLSKNSR